MPTIFVLLQEVNDEEMALAYGDLQGTIGRKFAGKKRSQEESHPIEDGPELMEQGQALMAKIKHTSQNRTWVNKNSGGSERGGKRKKFMKPPTE